VKQKTIIGKMLILFATLILKRYNEKALIYYLILTNEGVWWGWFWNGV